MISSLYSSSPTVTVDAAGGPDSIIGSEFDDSIDGGDGNNTLTASAFTFGVVTLSGGSGNDSLVGTNFSDSMNGGSGNDYVVAGAGNDTLTGGAGNDTLDGARWFG